MTWVLWNLVSVCWDTMLVLVQVGVWFAPNVPQAQKIVLDIMMVLLRDEAQMDACFVLFGDSAKLDAR